MKSILLAALMLLAFSIHVEAQADLNNSNIKRSTGKVKYQKTEQDATIFEVPYSQSQVEKGLRDLAQSRGVKVKEKNGFYEARNIKVMKLEGKEFDVYYKVEKTGKETCKVSMITAEPGQDITANPAVLPAEASGGSAGEVAGVAAGSALIAASVAPSLNAQDYALNKKQYEEELKKSENKVKDLENEQKQLEKRKSDLEKDIQRNNSDRQKAQAELDQKRANMTQFLEKGPVEPAKKN
jgi:septal ring factor EnvC (AmiA/AmiB activator)